MLILLVPLDVVIEEIIGSLFGKRIVLDIWGVGLGTLLNEPAELDTGLTRRLSWPCSTLKQVLKNVIGIPFFL
jgi:hypothetical protein